MFARDIEIESLSFFVVPSPAGSLQTFGRLAEQRQRVRVLIAIEVEGLNPDKLVAFVKIANELRRTSRNGIRKRIDKLYAEPVSANLGI